MDRTYSDYYFGFPYFVIENPQTGLLKSQSFMNGFRLDDIDCCKYGFDYRKRTRLWNNLTNWKSRAFCKKVSKLVRYWLAYINKLLTEMTSIYDRELMTTLKCGCTITVRNLDFEKEVKNDRGLIENT